MPVGRVHQHTAYNQKDEDGADFDGHHDVVRTGGLPDSAHQQHSQDEHHQKSGDVEISTGPLPGGPDRGRPSIRNSKAKLRQLIFQIAAETDRYRNVADGILQNQIPANDPGKNLT